MLLGIDGGCNDPRLKHVTCPCCKALGRFRYHSSYRRKLVDIEDGVVVVKQLVIDRVKCLSCKTTHACLPPEAVADSSLSVRLCLAIMASKLSVQETCDKFFVSVRTFYRIASHKIRVLLATGAPVALVCLKETATCLLTCSFCRDTYTYNHINIFNTTPFKNVGLKQSARFGRNGSQPFP